MMVNHPNRSKRRYAVVIRAKDGIWYRQQQNETGAFTFNRAEAEAFAKALRQQLSGYAVRLVLAASHRAPTMEEERREMMLTAQVALEWLRASGARTPERLRSLVDHFGHTNALQPSEVEEAYRQAAAAAGFDLKREA